MNRFAQPMYGKIIYIYETDLSIDKLNTIFSPDTYWIDVTGIECEVGYTVKFVDGVGIVFAPPEDAVEETVEMAKERKINEMKQRRDSEDDLPIEISSGHTYDFDTRAREKIEIAIAYLNNGRENEKIAWILADGSIVNSTLDMFNEVLQKAVIRSSENHYNYARLKAYIGQLENPTIEDINSIGWNFFSNGVSESENT